MTSPPPGRAELRTRLRDLERARADLPPHAAQGLREELDGRIAVLRRRLATRSGGATTG